MVRHYFPAEKGLAGAQLVRDLDATRLDVRAAFWLFDTESGRWRLHLAVVQVDSWGPKRIYAKIQTLLRGNRNLAPTEVSIVSPRHRTVRSLRSVVQTGKSLKAVQPSDNVANGEFIEDALVYRSL